MITYIIKQRLIIEPMIELPEGSQVVSTMQPFDTAPASWHVVWLEPETVADRVMRETKK